MYKKTKKVGTPQHMKNPCRRISLWYQKKNKAANLLKNWRPVTLLNCDYKIASKCIASRIQKVLPRLIHNNQTGFLKNRFIGENIRLVDSVINYANIEQIPGLLLFIDFEKAFDSLELSFFEKTLNY